jgi:hypothetical protein
MRDVTTGQQSPDAQEEVIEDEANAGQEPEAQAKPGPLPSGDGTSGTKPDSKFHG